MKFLLSWLREFIELSLPPQALAERLTQAGLEITSLSRVENDWVFEAEVTPNRPDLLSHLGLARETAAALHRPFRFPRWLQREFRAPTFSGEAVPVRVEDSEGCPLYVGLVLEGVRVGPSPSELVQRLGRLGIRSVNNVVDVTNLCLFEIGQPLHAFDLDRLEGSAVTVRRARAGEKLETLDGVTRSLTPELLVIADARKPVALAGILGGKNSEITPATRRVFLESACFQATRVRRGTRLAKASSDSSYRFERGVDREMVAPAALRAARWMTRIAGGTIRSRTETGPPAGSSHPILLKPRKAEEILGVRLTSVQQKRFLERMGCSVKGSGRGWRVQPPSWRSDLRIPEDLYEELARLFGYDRCPATLPPLPRRSLQGWKPVEEPRIGREQKIRQLLVAAGYQEIQTYSLLSSEAFAHCCAKPTLTLRNPLSAEQSCLRPTLLAGALTVLSLNLRRRSDSGFLFFEIGECFQPGPAAVGRKTLSLLAAGVPEAEWGLAQRALDLFRLKGTVRALCEQNSPGSLSEKEEEVPACQPGEAIAFFREGARWGWAGRIAPEVLASFEVPAEEPVAYAELDLEKTLETPVPELRIAPPSRFPAVSRDLALVVSEPVSYGQLQESILETGRPLLQESTLFDLYQGKQVPAGKKSLAFRLHFSNPERTLTEAEVTTAVEQILRALQTRFQATLRSF